MKRVTMKDIANVTGFSINTVSRALNSKPEVRTETKEKILETADVLPGDYQGGFFAIENLLEQGHTRIVMVNGPLHISSAGNTSKDSETRSTAIEWPWMSLL